MNENRTIDIAEIPTGGKSGVTWSRLHGERENICEAVLKDGWLVADERKEFLQARLRKIDDALDRLMSGSYGKCSKCGRAIDETRLDIDPALALCLNCWTGEPVAASSSSEVISTGDVRVASLKPFDTILLKTHNSDYRIMLLDPAMGRALVEGGYYLIEPTEALVRGSAVLGDECKDGEICVGCRLEMWVAERVFLTSIIKSIQIKRSRDPESIEEISQALH